MNASQGGPPAIGFTPNEMGGFVVRLFRCKTCGYLEMLDITNEEVADAIRKLETGQ